MKNETVMKNRSAVMKNLDDAFEKRAEHIRLKNEIVIKNKLVVMKKTVKIRS